MRTHRPDKEYLPELFEWLAPDYLRVTETISWGRYRHWMDAIATAVAENGPADLVDIGCGPGYLLSKIARACPGTRLVGVDPAGAALDRIPKWVSCRVEETDLHTFAEHEPHRFDGAVASFVLRDQSERKTFLADIHRVLKSRGRLWILETHTPTGVKGWGFSLYFQGLMPLWGRRLTPGWDKSRGPLPLDWLAQSHRNWHRGESLKHLLSEAGFTLCRSVFPESAMVMLIAADKI